MNQPWLELKDVECRYLDRVVIRGLSFALAKGELACLMGPSGCGKSTILRTIVGLEPITCGKIVLRGEVVSRPGYTLAPERRQVGMVFQDYTLFPHLTVLDNVCFGLHGLARAERRRIAYRLLEMLDLHGLNQRFPHELSGGQQQRVALARALAPQPDVLLLDEPFANLDAPLRERLSEELATILKDLGTSAITVTHNREEAFALGEWIGVLLDGRIVQWDTPHNLYYCPADRRVAELAGEGRFLPATLKAPDTLETEAGCLRNGMMPGWAPGGTVDVLLRPRDVVPDPQSAIHAEVVNRVFKGAEVLYTLRLPRGGTVLALFPSHLNHPIGAQVGIRLAPQQLVAFPHRS